MVCLNALTRHLQPQVIQARERGQVRVIKDSIGHVEVFQMDGVGTPIIGRPRPLPSHDTPNPAHNTYTLKCEEPNYHRYDDSEGLGIEFSKRTALIILAVLVGLTVLGAVAKGVSEALP